MARCRDHVLELLRIRGSSPLFRLASAEQVARHVSFLNTGPEQLPGVIAMLLSDPEARVDTRLARVLVVFNAARQTRRLDSATLRGLRLELHEVLRGSSDPRLAESRCDAERGHCEVPGRTTAVFVERRSAG